VYDATNYYYLITARLIQSNTSFYYC